MSRWGWRRYVPVAQRQKKAERLSKQLGKAGKQLEPVVIQGRSIAGTFWGKAWCENLEGYGDYANRLPRGRTYVRNGSVIDLKIKPGSVSALVSGSDVYKVGIEFEPLQQSTWTTICADCSGSIDSLLDLLAGKFATGVMQRLTRREGGLFPKPREIRMHCSCPDWATVCKHVAAVLYGVGARLDESPELLFVLRKVDHTQMLGKASRQALDEVLGTGASSELEGEDLSALFGIELEASAETEAVDPANSPESPKSPRTVSRRSPRTATKRPRAAATSAIPSRTQSKTARKSQSKSTSARKSKPTTTTKKATKKRAKPSQARGERENPSISISSAAKPPPKKTRAAKSSSLPTTAKSNDRPAKKSAKKKTAEKKTVKKKVTKTKS